MFSLFAFILYEKALFLCSNQLCSFFPLLVTLLKGLAFVSLAFTAIIPFQVFQKIYLGLISPDTPFLPYPTLFLSRKVRPPF